MKKNLILFIALVGLAGCEPLDEVPFSSLSEDLIYQDEADVDAALFGVYSVLNQGNGGANVDDLWYFLATSGPGESITSRFDGGEPIIPCWFEF